MEKNPKKGSSRILPKVLATLFIGISLVSLAIMPLTGEQHSVYAAPTDWQVKSMDTQIISKCWNNVPQDSIDKQVAMLKDLGVNYIAIGTPYDRPDEMAKWTNSIHNAGLRVWFRSHWLNWEGDEGQAKNLSTAEYLNKTKQFIVDHPNLFKSGDSFTMNVEAENVGLGSDKPFADWSAYNQFLRDEIDYSNSAFEQIGVNNVATNWLSMNGWIIENALEQSTVDKMGMITADHYPPQGSGSNLISINEMADNMSKDLDRFHAKWGKPIMIGEWGYHIDTDVSDDQQKQATEAIYNVFASKNYIFGVNYWDHMGNNTRIINDSGGTPTGYRPAADVIKSYYNNSISTPPANNPPSNPPTTPPAGGPQLPTNMIANFDNGMDGFSNGQIDNNALRLTNPASGSIGSEKLIDTVSLNGYANLEMDINLNGNALLPGDASAIYFDQGGWKWTSLINYVQNSKDGVQHILIPLKNMGIDLNNNAAKIGFRFWNNNVGNYDLDNIQLTKSGGTTPPSNGGGNPPAPNPNPTTPPTGGPNPLPNPPAPDNQPQTKVFDNFENGFKGWYGGKSTSGNDSSKALRISNRAKMVSGSRKMLNNYKIGDYNAIELDINLHGINLMSGTNSALYFEQNGSFYWVSLSDYAQGGKDGFQHIRIPMSDFVGLNKNSQITSLGFRIGNTVAGTYDIDNISFSK